MQSFGVGKQQAPQTGPMAAVLIDKPAGYIISFGLQVKKNVPLLKLPALLTKLPNSFALTKRSYFQKNFMKYLLIQLLLVPSLMFAQPNIRGAIVNKHKDPLPLTNIVLQNRAVGTITNEKGEFILSNITTADSIKITNIAYYSKVIAISNLRNNDTIILDENIQQLNDIVLKNLSKYKEEIKLGFDNYSNNGEFKFGPGNQIALFIANKLEIEGWIKGVSFKVKELGKCKNSMRIRLMQMDTLHFKPSIDILEENIIIKSGDLKKSNYLDLSTYKIMLPKEGIFIVLEWLYPDRDCDKNSYASISANLVEPSNIVLFNFRDKAWSKDSRPRLPNGNYMTPNIGLRVAY